MVVMTIEIAMSPARVKARRALVVMGAGEGEVGGGSDAKRKADGGSGQIGPPRRHSDSGKFPFRFKRVR